MSNIAIALGAVATTLFLVFPLIERSTNALQLLTGVL